MSRFPTRAQVVWLVKQFVSGLSEKQLKEIAEAVRTEQKIRGIVVHDSKES